MTDYTPTTEEVREIITSGVYRHYTADFDRWLAGLKAQVWEEAYVTGVSDVIADKGATMNPYRQGDTE